MSAEEFRAPFWDWSLKTYQNKGVSTLLLRLQDEAGLDVNMALWCLWCARDHAPLGVEAMKDAMNAAGVWNRDIAAPLRTVRRALKSPPKGVNDDLAAHLKKRVKKAELEAEEIEQTLLAELAAATCAPAADGAIDARARENLALYARLAAPPDASAVTLMFDELVALVWNAPAIAADATTAHG